MSDQAKKSVMDGFTTGEHVELNFTDDDVVELIEVLSFAHETAKFVLEVEISKGSSAGADKIRRYMNNARHLLDLTYMSIDTTGKPKRGEMH